MNMSSKNIKLWLAVFFTMACGAVPIIAWIVYDSCTQKSDPVEERIIEDYRAWRGKNSQELPKSD